MKRSTFDVFEVEAVAHGVQDFMHILPMGIWSSVSV
jgi:hypothetical protein